MIMTINRHILASTVVLTVALSALTAVTRAQDTATGPASAGDTSAAQSQAGQRTGSTTGQTSDTHVSDAERHQLLKEMVEQDRAKLSETKQELETQEAVYRKLNVMAEKLEKEVTEKKRRLEAMGGPGASDQAGNLSTEISSLEQRLALGKSELDVRFNSAKMLKTRIRSLEQKIAKQQEALNELIDIPAPASANTEAEAPAASTPETPSPTTLTPQPMVAPGVATAPETAANEAQQAGPETAEQIEARKEAEKLEAEAKLAEQDLESFVERKQVLDEQIKIQKELLRATKSSRQNIDSALAQARSEAVSLIEQGASKEKMREVQRRISEIEKLQQENRKEIDQRNEYLDSLYKQRDQLSAEQLDVIQHAETKREQAGQAKKRSVWLVSPLHPRNVARWAMERGPRILIVIAVAWALLLLVRFASRRVARSLFPNVSDAQTRGTNRADTLALSFQSAASLLIVVAAILLAFQEAGVDIKTVLGGAAIIGVAFAFGAQNLMRDYFTGFMIVLEDQYQLGDLITVGNITGRVEKVNMRTTVLRDLEGRVHFIPNGEIKSVTNRTYVWGRAVLDIPVSFKEDVDRVMRVILEVEEAFRTDPEFSGWVIEDPVMMGLDRFNEYGMIIKTYVQTQPDKIFQTRRELLRRIKKRFDEEGIEISVPHRMLLQSTGGLHRFTHP